MKRVSDVASDSKVNIEAVTSFSYSFRFSSLLLLQLLRLLLLLQVVEKWIRDIEELHRNQPPPTVQYSKPMPDIDHLMQVRLVLGVEVSNMGTVLVLMMILIKLT